MFHKTLKTLKQLPATPPMTWENTIQRTFINATIIIRICDSLFNVTHSSGLRRLYQARWSPDLGSCLEIRGGTEDTCSNFFQAVIQKMLLKDFWHFHFAFIHLCQFLSTYLSVSNTVSSCLVFNPWVYLWRWIVSFCLNFTRLNK